MFDCICRGGGAQVFEPYESSMFHLAWTMAVAPQSETPEDWQFYKGAGEVAKIIANELGSRVFLDSLVSTINHDLNGVQVTYGDCKRINAKAAVVAIPPTFRLNI